MRHHHIFVIKILADDAADGSWHGQISEPGSADTWRAVFLDVNDLSRHLTERVAAGRAQAPMESDLIGQDVE